MANYVLGDIEPQFGEGAWTAPSAELLGDVRMGARSSVWFHAVLRADNSPMVIGDESNIQDGAICHSDPGIPLTIGARVTVGHQAILHGCTVHDDCLIRMGARILNRAIIGPECIVGAGALVTEGKTFEGGQLIIGAPARAVRPITSEEKATLRASAVHYCEKAARYSAALRER